MILVGPTQKLRHLVLINNFIERFFVATSYDRDFLLSFFVYEGFGYGPDDAEEHWRIYNEHLSEGLWIIVLGYTCC